jgi:hypothetical protein
MTAPQNPQQLTNANAANANGASASNIKTNSTGSASVSSSKDSQEIYNAKIHAIASLRPQVESILSQYGFVPVTYQPQLQRKLTIQIMDLNNNDGLQETIEVDAINGMLTYSKSYTGTASAISIDNLNDKTSRLSSDLLTKALGDAQLIEFLSQS